MRPFCNSTFRNRPLALGSRLVTPETAAATIVEYPPLAKATAAGATVLVEPFKTDDREGAMVQSPGRYIAEIHTVPPP